MARQRSAEYSSRRLRGWQLAALVAAGSLAAAGCSSSSSSSSSTTSTSSSPAVSSSVSAAPGNATSGTINWWASPINTSGTDVRTVLIQRLREGVPGHQGHADVGADEHRHQPRDAGHRHLGRLGHPGRIHGRRDLARAVRRAPAGGAAVGLPAVQLLRSVRTWSGPGRHLQRQGLRVADVRGPAASCTTARTCWPRRTCRCPRPGSSCCPSPRRCRRPGWSSTAMSSRAPRTRA